MNQQRLHQITDYHLNRLAVLYCPVRRSQVEADSLSVPDGLEDARQQAIEWGWSPVRVIAIEDVWEASSPGASRDGFRRLRRLVAREEVGIIVTATNSCFPWLDGDLLSLLSLYRDANTLLAVNGAIVDPDEQIDHRLARIRANIAEYDNQQRTDIVMWAKRSHAAMGRAVSRPPTGYIAYAKGQWKKDPAVSAQIAEVFRLYEALGSAGKEERIVVRNHHEPYVTPKTWHRINQWLRRRAGRVHQQISVEPPRSEEGTGNDQAAPPSGEGMEETNE